MLDETAELFNFVLGTLPAKPKMDDFSGASIRSTFSGMIIAKIGRMIEMEMTPTARTKTQEANKKAFGLLDLEKALEIAIEKLTD